MNTDKVLYKYQVSNTLRLVLVCTVQPPTQLQLRGKNFIGVCVELDETNPLMFNTLQYSYVRIVRYSYVSVESYLKFFFIIFN